MTRVHVAAVYLLVAAVIMAPAAKADELPELKFEKFELPNGLDVILHEDHAIPMVSVNVMYHVGSKNESHGRTGFAHLFEHMMFQGSEHFNRNFTEGIVKHGGVRNGGTNSDITSYWENMPSNYLEKTLWLESDRMGYLLPAVTQERFEIQRSVVMNEKRENVDDQPYGKVEELSLALLYPNNHPYSWSTIGRMEDLEAATLEDVQAFFRKYYTPNNASLCIAGDFDPAQAKQWVEKYFGPIPAGEPIDRMEVWIPELKNEIRASLEDEVKLPRLYITWHTPAHYAPGDAEFDLLASVLVAGKSSRLYKELVYDKQMAQDVTAYQESGEIGSLFRVVVTAREGHTLAQIEQEVDHILNDVLIKGVTADEFERARTNWEAGFVRQLESIGGFGGRASKLNSYNLSLGDPGRLLWDRSRYTEATAEGMLDYAQRYLKPNARLVLYVEPQGELEATDSGVDMALEPSGQSDPSFDPPLIKQATLSNGLELYLVENHKLPLAQVNLIIKSGWSSDPADRAGTASLMAELINEGTKSRTALEISDEARALGLNFGAGSTFDYTNVNLNTLKRNLDPALDLMADVILNPTFPQEELERQKQIYLGRIKQESSQAITVAFKRFLRDTYGENHPYGQPYTGSGTVESIAVIGRSDLIDFYKKHVIPNNAAAIVVGDLTLDEARAKLEAAFKKWKPGPDVSHQVATVEPLPSTQICIVDLPGSSQSTIVVGNLCGSRDDPKYLPATVVSAVLGGGPTGRLYRNLRQEKGYTYGSYSMVTGRRGQGALIAYAQVQGDVTREAIEEFIKEFRGVRGEIPVTEEELSDKKNNLTKGFPQTFQSIAGVAGQLQTIIAYGLSLDEWETYVDRVNQIDVTRALAAAQDLIDPDALLIVVVGDQAQIEPRIREMGLGEVYIANTL